MNSAEKMTKALMEEYESLLLKRDRLLKESDSVMMAYIKEFGDLISDNFRLKIKCIKKKKMISYCKRRINRDLPINIAHMNEEIEAEMKNYYAEMKHYYAEMKRYYMELKAMSKDSKVTEKSKIVIESRLEPELPDSYLAPSQAPCLDLYSAPSPNPCPDYSPAPSPNPSPDPCADLCPAPCLEKNSVPELEEKILSTERQINDILNSEPYIYIEILEDEGKKEAYKEQLLEEKKDFKDYLKRLKTELEGMSLAAP